MSIYTKTGDAGETSLANCQRVSKSDDRLEAYGTADELNAWIGMLRASLPCEDAATDEHLRWIQNKLFNLGASLSEAPGEWLTEADVQQLENWIDAIQQQLPPLRAFVLPSGGKEAARCHVCRTVTRRLERRMVKMACQREQERQFVNRLSDYFFVLARLLVRQRGKNEENWQK